jgi:imidazolonepropionase-like amidohydrolase
VQSNVYARLIAVAIAMPYADLALSPAPAPAPGVQDVPAKAAVAYVNARIIDGTGAAPIEQGAMVVQDGRIREIGAVSAVRIPDGAARVDLAGKTVMPGLINAHGHITDVRGLEAKPEHYTPEHITQQLRLYARYGITTVFSLGGDGPPAIAVRDAKPAGVARLYVAGPVVSAASAEAAQSAVDAVTAIKADLVKIRVDDNLGAGRKMPPEAYRATIARAHALGLEVSAHIFYLQDAKDVLDAGVDMIAHSVRDLPVDRAVIAQLKARDVCVCPTLMRDVSTFVYESRPAFLDDPFFTRDADPAAVEGVQTPQHQRSNRTPAAVRYKAALDVAKSNLKMLSDAGVRIAMGTDSGPAARFQGYFEHLELEQMVSAGLTPMQAIVASTGDAARCMNVADRVGTLKAGMEADFIVLGSNPLDGIRNTRTLESVWVRGDRVQR